MTPSDAGAIGSGEPADVAARRRAGVLVHGVWRLRRDVATLLDVEPVRLFPWSRTDVDLVVGWGHRRTAAGARSLARRRGLPFVALEDGFLRSVRPGRGEGSIGWIVDRSGIYYDASESSDLETAILRRAAQAPTDRARATAAMARLRELRLSKYNHAPMRSPAALGLPFGRDVVLVVDQTYGDASIVGAGAKPADFVAMLDAAIAENPGRTIAVKVHPEAISGAKRGHLVDAARKRDVVLVDADVNPWALIETAVAVYVVSSQFGLEAMIAGVPVVCFGAAAYAGWGLTDDRFAPIARRTATVDRETLFAAAYFDYCRWLDPWFGRRIGFEEAVERLAFLRDRFHDETRSICVGMTRWKRGVIRPFLDGVDGPPRFARSMDAAAASARAETARIVVWGDGEAAGRALAPGAATLVRTEDGFLRSVGLGAAFVSPASLVFDDEGIYYDPRRPSRFERLARETEFDAELLARAAHLREAIVTRRLSKYNDARDERLDLPTDRLRILVPGQVEDDASVRLGSPAVTTNVELLRRVRARWPDAFIVYKPHPDVHAGYRRGAVPKEESDRLVDRVVSDVSMPSLLADVDRVETMTSLTGFEALLRGLDVATHGLPFYAGWGLTDDALAVTRRDRRLTLDELVAVALILYPRYVDPVSGRPCPVETIVERLSEGRSAPATATARLASALRHTIARAAHGVFFPLARFAGLRRR
ncbi:capsular polysaccharide biosynthesis protein [Pinisolibacter sp.]|uniref:capsular polysaccharide biosynthesis protein n=1 Tax=Pinisolibacter sp. TaxID=2172024 RepID=UPI002FDDE10C